MRESGRLFADEAKGRERSQEPVRGEPRVLRANRAQLFLRPTDLESLLAEDHAARAVWDFVTGRDLSPLYAEIPSLEGQAGRPAIDPAILLALWVYATVEGEGSARGVARRMEAGLVRLNRVAQDGMRRVRASAGAASYRRRKRLRECLRTAEKQVEALRYGQGVEEVLVDGGYAGHENIEHADARGCRIYAPVPKPRNGDRDPHRPLPDDPPGVSRWRHRMGEASAKEK